VPTRRRTPGWAETPVISTRTSLLGAALGVGAVLSGAAAQTCLRLGPLRWRHTDGFYQQHVPQPGRHGEVLAAEPLQAYLLPGLKLRADAWRILYRSSNLDDEPRTVSGTILVPHRRRPAGLVAYAPGTHGLANYSAPSRLIARGLDWETAFVAHLLGQGHAVVMTDYEGLGTPGDHPYVIGRTIGRNVLDSLRAALSFGPAGLEPSIPLGIMGYSEGGNASAWAAELHPVYAPELAIAGCASGSIPADLESAGQRIDGSLYAFFGGYGALGLNAAYPSLDLAQYLTAEGERHMHRLRRSSVVTATLRGPHFLGFSAMTTENPLHIPEWQARMRENRLGTSAPTAPVYLYTSVRDHLVEPSQTRDLARRWRARGADVHLQEVPAVDHITGLMLGGHGASRWLNGQLRRAAQGVGADHAASHRPA
jgi:hypothetical protein